MHTPNLRSLTEIDLTDLTKVLVRDTAASAPEPLAAEKQPVHLIATGAHLFRRNTLAKLGTIAEGYARRYAPDPESLQAMVPDAIGGLGDDDAAAVHGSMMAKLSRDPVQSILIDFEDGFGSRSDSEEDEAAVFVGGELAHAHEQGSLPESVAIRVRPIGGSDDGTRAVRTLDLVLTSAVRLTRDGLPQPFNILLPKVLAPSEVEFMTRTLDRLEARLGLTAGDIGIELLVESAQALVAPDGRFATRALVEAGEGRCQRVHLGAYDFLASAEIAGRHQDLGHPLCDAARQVMKLALAETGVRLVDGVTVELPVEPHRGGTALTEDEMTENRRAVRRGWQVHAADVRRSLAQGFYQSWDLHPSQFVSRYAAVFSFYREGLADASVRLREFARGARRSRLTGSTFDDEASVRGLVNFFRRGLACGALTQDDLANLGAETRDLVDGDKP